MSHITVQAECTDCGATGLYSGFAEKKGTAVVCLGCDGTGCMEISYTPFERRRGRRGITKVFASRGTFLATGLGAVGKSVTYQEFQAGILPR